MLGFLRKTLPNGSNKNAPNPPISPLQKQTRGNYLRKHHMQTAIICIWVLCIIAYIVAIEKAIYAHSKLTPGEQNSMMGAENSFGNRGTRKRQETVQIFSFARTILTALHVGSDLA